MVIMAYILPAKHQHRHSEYVSTLMLAFSSKHRLTMAVDSFSLVIGKHTWLIQIRSLFLDSFSWKE